MRAALSSALWRSRRLQAGDMGASGGRCDRTPCRVSRHQGRSGDGLMGWRFLSVRVFKEAQWGDRLLFLLRVHLGGWSLCLTSARHCPRTEVAGRSGGPERGSWLLQASPGSSPRGSRLSPDLCFQDGAPVRGASGPRRRGADLSEPARPGGPMGFSLGESRLQFTQKKPLQVVRTPCGCFQVTSLY